MKRLAVTIALVGAAAAVAPLGAHKPVTSKYTYSEDVYPIVKEHCGGCHVGGGIAPMSLLTYEDARPWAESIRLELTSGHMPPWYGDPGVAPLRDVHRLSPRDLDVVLTWVTGGTPPGLPMKTAPATARRSWPKGRPDLVLQMPAPVTLASNKSEDTQEFVLRDDNDRDRMVAVADLLPGNPSIVHDAIIFSRRPGAAEPAAVFNVWLPGSAPAAPAAGFAVPWHAHDQLVVRIHYKKNWKLENKPASDRSAVGLYLTKSTAREIHGVDISGGDALSAPLQALAIRVAGGNSDAPVRVDAIRPDGTRLTIAGFVARAGWDQRYWLARPIDLPKGSRIDVRRAVAMNVRVWLDASTM
jgi:mono/diheme cytochrome c family protein